RIGACEATGQCWLRRLPGPPYPSRVRTSQTIRGFFHEARRRKVIGAVVAYAIAAAGVMQVADVVAPRMNLPDATVTITIFIGIIGLPIVAVLSWFYNL